MTANLEDKVKARIKACQDTIKEHELLIADQGGDWAMRSHYEGILHALEWTLKEVRNTIYLEFQMETKGDSHEQPSRLEQRQLH